MRTILNKLFKILITLSFIGIIIIDFFPIIRITPFMVSALIFIVLATITKVRSEQKPLPNFRKELIESIYLLGGLLLLLTVLTLLGGESQSGLGLNKPNIWILYIFFIIMIFVRYKKLKKQ